MNVGERFEKEVCEHCTNKECKRRKDTMAGCAAIAMYFEVCRIAELIKKRL